MAALTRLSASHCKVATLGHCPNDFQVLTASFKRLVEDLQFQWKLPRYAGNGLFRSFRRPIRSDAPDLHKGLEDAPSTAFPYAES